MVDYFEIREITRRVKAEPILYRVNGYSETVQIVPLNPRPETLDPKP